jgi:hypothetical protein
MGSYKLTDFLTQEIPDHLILDIALHFQANDNRYASSRSRQWELPRGHPSHQANHAASWLDQNEGEPPHNVPQGVDISAIGERLGSLWNWSRATVARPVENVLSSMAQAVLTGISDRQPG